MRDLCAFNDGIAYIPRERCVRLETLASAFRSQEQSQSSVDKGQQ